MYKIETHMHTSHVSGCSRIDAVSLAEEYAAYFHLLRLGGSDCHGPGEIGLGGIIAEELPEDTAGFARLIRSGGYTVIGAETPQKA